MNLSYVDTSKIKKYLLCSSESYKVCPLKFLFCLLYFIYPIEYSKFYVRAIQKKKRLFT